MKLFYGLLLITSVISISSSAQSLAPGQVTDNVYNKALLCERFSIVNAKKTGAVQILQTKYAAAISTEQDIHFSINYNAQLNTLSGTIDSNKTLSNGTVPAVLKPSSHFAAHTNLAATRKFNFMQLMLSLHNSNAAVTVSDLQLNGMNITGSYTANTTGDIYWHLVYGEFGKDFTVTGNIHLKGNFSKADVKNMVEFNFGTSSSLTAASLSVYWGDINADQQNNANVINWNTNKEVNNDRFVIERANDGINFTGIGLVTAAGNRNSVISYNYTDNKFSEGINYYRIKQIDIEGHSNYSVVVKVINNSTAMAQHPGSANNNSGRRISLESLK